MNYFCIDVVRQGELEHLPSPSLPSLHNTTQASLGDEGHVSV